MANRLVSCAVLGKGCHTHNVGIMTIVFLPPQTPATIMAALGTVAGGGLVGQAVVWCMRGPRACNTKFQSIDDPVSEGIALLYDAYIGIAPRLDTRPTSFIVLLSECSALSIAHFPVRAISVVLFSPFR
jgi:hypothetical protein